MSHDSLSPVTTVQLNHTAVHAKGRQLSAEFIAVVLGPAAGARTSPTRTATTWRS